MARRSLAQARRFFEEEILPRASDRAARESQAFLEAAEARAQTAADKFTAEREDEIRAARDLALRDLTAVRDELEDLRSLGNAGRIAAADYSDRLSTLRDRQEAAEARLAEAERTVGTIEQIEANPVEWFDGVTKRHPKLLTEFPW